MQTYCLGCRRQTGNIDSKNVSVTNKAIRQKSRCANCMSDKSRFFKQKHNKKGVGIILISWIILISYINHYKTCLHIACNAKEIQKTWIQEF